MHPSNTNYLYIYWLIISFFEKWNHISNSITLNNNNNNNNRANYNYQLSINHKHSQTFTNIDKQFYFSTENTKQWISIYFNYLLFLKMNEKQNHNWHLIYCLNYGKLADISVPASRSKIQDPQSPKKPNVFLAELHQMR